MKMVRAQLLLMLMAAVPCAAQTAVPEKFEVASVRIDQYSKANCGNEPRGCAIFPTWGGATFTATNDAARA